VSRLHAGAASVVLLLTFLLPWYPAGSLSLLRTGAAEIHLVWLAALVTVTTAWYGQRLGYVAAQVLAGATFLALMSASPALTWFGLTLATAAGVAATGERRHVPTFSAGLMLALFGTLLLYLAAEPGAAAIDGAVSSLASVLLLLGYGTVAITAVGTGLLGSVVATVPLLVVLGLGSDSVAFANLLIGLGIVSLLATALGGVEHSAVRRLATRAGIAQLGVTALAIGLGGTTALVAAWFGFTSLTLARAALLQCEHARPSRAGQWAQNASALALPVLLLLTVLLLTSPIIGHSAWLMLPVSVATLAAVFALINGLPDPLPTVGGTSRDTLSLGPIWLQLALALGLAIAMPNAALDWFHMLAESG
jgi:hypothetical protein